MEKRERIWVRMYPSIHKLAKSRSALQGKPLAEWLEEAIEAKISKEEQDGGNFYWHFVKPLCLGDNARAKSVSLKEV